jgi:hypothetical protein
MYSYYDLSFAYFSSRKIFSKPNKWNFTYWSEMFIINTEDDQFFMTLPTYCRPSKEKNVWRFFLTLSNTTNTDKILSYSTRKETERERLMRQHNKNTWNSTESEGKRTSLLMLRRANTKESLAYTWSRVFI